MGVLKTETKILAPVGVVWGILTDFRNFERWNPFVRAIYGQIAVGSPLQITLAWRGHAKVTQRHIVLRADAPRELRWRHRFCLPGLYDVQHGWCLDVLPDGVTRLRHSRAVRGRLAEWLGEPHDAALTEAMKEMNQALKMRAERAHRAATLPPSPAEMSEQTPHTTRLNTALFWEK